MKNTAIILLAAIIILSSSADAVQTKYEYFLSSSADAVGKYLSDLAARLVYMGMVWTRISNIKYEIYDNLPYFLLNDPQPASPQIASISSYFIGFLEPLYVTAILLTGIYLLFFSGTPEGRMKAKATLISLILGMVIISTSTYLIQLLLDTSNSLTRNILGQGPIDVGLTYRKAIDYLNYRAIDFMWTNIILGIPFLLLSLLATAGIFIMLAARYFFLIFLIIFFPAAIFLTFFPPTRTVGNTLLRQLIFWAFLPAAYALVLVTIVVSSQNLTGIIPELSSIINLTGTLVLIASPLIIYGIMDWVGVFVSYTLQFVKLTAPLTTEAQTKAASKRPASDRKKTSTTKSAVGMKGYATVEEKEEAEREKDAIGSALGFGGYKTTKTSPEETEAGIPGATALKRKKPVYSSMYGYAEENKIVPSYGYGNTGQQKQDSSYGYADEVVPGRAAQEHGTNAQDAGTTQEQATSRGTGTSSSTAAYNTDTTQEQGTNAQGTGTSSSTAAYNTDTTQEQGTNAQGTGTAQQQGTESRGVGMSSMPASYKEPQKKEKIVEMKLRPKFTTEYELEIAPGESMILNVVVVNDGKTPFYRITIYDENLTDSGFDITYSTRSFALKPGEEKAVKIKIAADPALPNKTYEGEIIFKTEKLEVKSTLEMTIKTGEEKEKIFQEESIEEEQDTGFTHSAETEEKKEKLKHRNIFGEEEETKAPAKKKTPGEKKEGGKETSKDAGKAKEQETQHRAPIMRTAAQPEMETEKPAPPTLNITPPLTTPPRAPKPVKLLKPKKTEK
jgi:hypothetical protein